ncbi:MAG TPA: serine hydrolase [Myxococcota bacterium]|nr:serine hydrolase [Myxococcota bacterium]
MHAAMALLANGSRHRFWLCAFFYPLAAVAAGPALVPLPRQPAGIAFPTTDWVVTAPASDGDAARLSRALDEAFSEPELARLRRTRAVVVVHGGRIVAERYAPGFGPQTPLLGWSMTKSVTNALCGILLREGKLELSMPAPVPEWKGVGDARREITVDLLLRQSSGLRWNEVYETSPFDSSVINMLYGLGHRDMAAFAASQPLAHPPGTVWSYSSGTTLILSRILRSLIGSDSDYHAFPRRELFERIGMKSAVMEPDVAGTFVGSSYSYATARDWARFGLLYLRDGTWEGERILPAGWVDYTRTPAPAAPHGEYGAHFWLNAGAAERGAPSPDPRAPADLFYASGHDGQVVAIVPSRDLVIVRAGLTPDDGRYDVNGFVDELVAVFSPVAP